MEDVLVPSGGFLPVYITCRGYIMSSGLCIHRETRNMQEWHGWDPSFTSAKERIKSVKLTGADRNYYGGETLGDEPIKGLLELTTEGGGLIVWIYPEDKPLAKVRLKQWAGCYGGFGIHLLSKDAA